MIDATPDPKVKQFAARIATLAIAGYHPADTLIAPSREGGLHVPHDPGCL